MILVLALNLLVILISVGIFLLIRSHGVEFALGVIFSTSIWNIVHRLHYGRWF